MRILLTSALITFSSIVQATSIEMLVTRVIDGDTLEVLIPGDTPGWNLHRVRLAGLNTPELSSRCLTPQSRNRERALAKQAKLFVEQQITGPIRVEKAGKDSFNRPLVEVWISGDSLNQKLLENKIALPYAKGKKGLQWCTYIPNKK